MDVQLVLTYFTPFLVFGAAWIALKILPLIPGWLILTVVTILSAILTFLTQLSGNPELEWYYQLLLGMGSIVISQIIIQFTPSKIIEDKKWIAEAKAEENL